jgi:hypothetical protein
MNALPLPLQNNRKSRFCCKLALEIGLRTILVLLLQAAISVAETALRVSPKLQARLLMLLLPIPPFFGRDYSNFLIMKESSNKLREERINCRARSSSMNCWSGRRQTILLLTFIPAYTPNSSPNFTPSMLTNFWLNQYSNLELAT